MNYSSVKKFLYIIVSCLILQSVELNAQKDEKGTVKSEVKMDLIASDTLSKQIRKDPVKLISFKKSHNLTFYTGYGLSAGKFDPTFGDNKNGGGMLFGIDYVWAFHKHWSLTGGIDFSSYDSDFKADATRTETIETDSEGDEFILYSDYSGWVENQKLYTLGVPITVRYNVAIGKNKKWNFFVGTGIRTSFATGGFSEVTDGTVELSAYYPEYNLYYEDVAWQGYDTQTFREKKSTETKVNFSSISDLGFSLKINSIWSLYAATYFEYGLLNLKDDSYQEPLIAYDGANDTPYYNFVPYSNTIDETNTIAVGGKLGVLYTFGNKKSNKNKQTSESSKKSNSKKSTQNKSSQNYQVKSSNRL